ncbi:MAG: hypothetical protein QOI86_2911 [Actinomycetota bacterium]|jgi:hypothetical protein|nr:hypothetical protein [Actinomycetota bacterium]
MAVDPQRFLEHLWALLAEALEGGDDPTRTYVLAAALGFAVEVFANPSPNLRLSGPDDCVRFAIAALIQGAVEYVAQGDDEAGEQRVDAAFRLSVPPQRSDRGHRMRRRR